VLEVFQSYGLTHSEAVPIVDSLRLRPKQWIDFMMRFELGLEEPDPRRAVRSASTIAGAYIAGGLIPLAPYMLFASASSALLVSVVATILALAIFGAVKGHYTGMPLASSALRTAFIGGLAAAAAFGIARLVSGGK
jgi:VIT1/CCC1 family predicted Fe2+/Mn2+ transporter